MFRTCALGLVAVIWTAVHATAEEKYSVKTATTPVPKELKEPIAKLLSDHSVQVIDDKGKLYCEIWFRKDVPAKASPEQIQNGLTYRELEETTLLGAVRFDQAATDYRKQKIKPGVYTLRLAFQPMDGDHMGTAPYPEFCLVVPADTDPKPDPMPPKELHELSSKATGSSHPGVFLLFPNSKPEDQPQLVSMEGKWVLNVKETVASGGKTAALGVGLTVVGHAD
jgi:hypothetical protein